MVIVRIGAWIDPDSTEVLKHPANSNNQRAPHERKAWGSKLSDFFKGRGRSANLAVAEDHPYRTAECPIDEALIDRLDVLTHRSRNKPSHKPGPLTGPHWPRCVVKPPRRTAANHLWVSLRKTGEIISLLGLAARFFQKNSGPNHSLP